jgi:ketosteroid isomerase-like protein
MRTATIGVGISLAFLLAACPAWAEDATGEIHRLSLAYDAAIVACDVKALDRLFDDNGQFIGSDSRVFDKKAYLAEYTDPKTTYESARVEDRAIRVLGDTAIETGRFIATGTRDGEPFREHVRFTAVWIK